MLLNDVAYLSRSNESSESESDLSDSSHSSESFDSTEFSDVDTYSTDGSAGDDVGDLSSLLSDCDELTSSLTDSFEDLNVKDKDDRFDDAMMRACDDHFENVVREFNAKKKYTHGPDLNEWYIDECSTVFGNIMNFVGSPMPSDAVVYRLRELMEPLLIEGYLNEDQIYDLVKGIYMRYKQDRGPDITIEKLELKYGTVNQKNTLPFKKQRDVTHKPKQELQIVGKHDGKRRNFDFFTETSDYV